MLSTSDKWNHTIFVLSCLASLSYHNVEAVFRQAVRKGVHIRSGCKVDPELSSLKPAKLILTLSSLASASCPASLPQQHDNSTKRLPVPGHIGNYLHILFLFLLEHYAILQVISLPLRSLPGLPEDWRCHHSSLLP